MRRTAPTATTIINILIIFNILEYLLIISFRIIVEINEEAIVRVLELVAYDNGELREGELEEFVVNP